MTYAIKHQKYDNVQLLLAWNKNRKFAGSNIEDINTIHCTEKQRTKSLALWDKVVVTKTQEKIYWVHSGDFRGVFIAQ